MTSVFLLHHVHEFDDGHENVKLIGMYSTEEQARRTLERIVGAHCWISQVFASTLQVLKLVSIH